MPKPPNVFEGGGLAEGEGRFAVKSTLDTDELLKTVEAVEQQEAREVLGNDFFGPPEIQKVFGVTLEKIPPIPFTREELEKAKELGQQLILFTDVVVDEGAQLPATINNLFSMYPSVWDGNRMGVRMKDVSADFRAKETPRMGWRLVSKKVIPRTEDATYIGSLRVLANYFGELDAGRTEESWYQSIWEEVNREGVDIEDAMAIEEDWRSSLESITRLRASQCFGERAVECVYRLIVNQELHDTRLLSDTYVHTTSIFPDQGLVRVGFFREEGMALSITSPLENYPQVGMCFSRGAAPK